MKNSVFCKSLALVSKLLTILWLNSHQKCILSQNACRRNNFENVENQPLFLPKSWKSVFNFFQTISFNEFDNLWVKNTVGLSIPRRFKSLKVLKNGFGDPGFEFEGEKAKENVKNLKIKGYPSAGILFTL